MKKTQLLTLATLLAASAAAVAAPGGGTTSVETLFGTIKTTMENVSLVVVTIAVIWAGYKVLFQGNQLQEVAKPLIGGIMIGAAGWIASLLVK